MMSSLLNTMTQYAPEDVYHIVSVSSGVPSALTAIEVIKQYHGISPIELVFADTLVEHDDNYRFLMALTEYTGYAVTVLSRGKSPMDLMREQNVIFTQVFAPCTRILKLEPIFEHVESIQAQGYQVVMHIGYDLGDQKKGRLESTTHNWQSKGVIVQYPLVDALVVDPMSELKRLGVSPTLTYNWGLKHANCLSKEQGGCVKFGQADMIKVLEHNPEGYAARELLEFDIRKSHALNHLVTSVVLSLYTGCLVPVVGQLYAFLRDTTSEDGQITLRDLRMRYEQAQIQGGIQLKMFELDADLAGCSVECGLTSDVTWDAVPAA
jgi:hypothetical protein